MVPAEIGVPALAALHVLMLAAVGIGPSLVLLRDRAEVGLALSPAVGLAISAAVLTTVALIVPLRVAGPVVVLGLVVLSGALAWRARPWPGAGLVWPGAAVGAGALGFACLPALLGADTYGPVDLYFADSWFYIPVNQFLADSALSSRPASPAQWPWLAFPLRVHEEDTRVGIDVVQAALFALGGTSPARGALAAQASLAGIVPLATYGAARAMLGAQHRGWAAFAAVAAMTPVTVQLFADPRPANLAAMSLVVLLVLAAGVALSGPALRRPAVLTGIAASGIAVTYTEHVPTLLLGVGAGLVVMLVIDEDRRRAARRIGILAGIAAGAAILLSPLGLVRAVEYAIRLGDGAIVGGPAIEGVRLRTLVPLFGGTIHQYQLDVLGDWTATRKLLTYGLALGALGIAGLGVLRCRRAALPGAVVLCGTIVAASIALYTWFQLRGECSYCVAKTATISPPLVALAGTFGLLVLSREATDQGVRGTVAVATALWLGFVLVSGLGLIRATERTPMRLDDRDHEITAAVRGLPPGPLLVEGAESGPDVAPFFDVPAALYLTSVTGRLVRYPEVGLAYLFGAGLPTTSYAPDYRYVLSRFPGMRTDRRPLRRFGQYGLYERAEVDVLVIAQQARDVLDLRDEAIPWLRGPVTLRVAGADRGAAVHLSLRGTDVARATFSVSAGRVKAGPPGEATRDVCVWVPPGAAVRDITFVVNGLSLPETPRRPVELPARSPRAAGIDGLSAAASPRDTC